MPGDVVEVADRVSHAAAAADSLKPVVQRLGDRLGLGLSREPRKKLCELLGSPISDVQGHSASPDFDQARQGFKID